MELASSWNTPRPVHRWCNYLCLLIELSRVSSGEGTALRQLKYEFERLPFGIRIPPRRVVDHERDADHLRLRIVRAPGAVVLVIWLHSAWGSHVIALHVGRD